MASIPGAPDLRLSLLAAGDMGPSGGSNARRDAWLQRQGVAPDRVALRRQTHSQRVAVVGRDSALQREYEADGVVTADCGVSPAVTVADCMPIFVQDRRRNVRAVLHSGWKGTGIVAAALQLMRQKWGTHASEMAVVLGPCIGVCCYRVDQIRAQRFAARWGGDAVRSDASGSHYLDLRRANITILRDLGVPAITVVTDCTACNPDLGSYRRQGAAGFTRMIAVCIGEQ
ncbi:MAG: laccase domain-containing protein [Spirochaetaceae bacterium]|nr:MAG: laccase domain-containing protein [Spirochaetaceae bacterium]